MGCGCKKNKTQEQTTPKPPANISLTEVKQQTQTQTTQNTTQQTTKNSN